MDKTQLSDQIDQPVQCHFFGCTTAQHFDFGKHLTSTPFQTLTPPSCPRAASLTSFSTSASNWRPCSARRRFVVDIFVYFYLFTFSIVYLYFQLRVLHVAGCGLVSNFLLDKLATVAKCEFSALSRLTSLVYLSYEDEPAVQSCEGRLLAETLQGEQD